MSDLRVQIPGAYRDLFRRARYKVFYGGRGGAKSWNFARALVTMSATLKLRILCTRELQSSIADSVHRLLCDQIVAMGLSGNFFITDKSITSSTGSEFIFKGLKHNAREIKSMEGIDICWVEEADSTSAESLSLLVPTIRKEGSELWFSLNLKDIVAPVYQRLIKNPPPDSIVRLINFDANPFFTTVLEKERQYALSLVASAEDDVERQQAQADYDHVWLGMPQRKTGAAVIRRWVEAQFEAEPGTCFLFGADWGFANDPTALIRAFMKDDCLFIDHEAFGYGVEIDEIAALFDSVPGARDWPIKADNARPETISFVRRQGFNISAAEKWNGSIEDGIAHLNGFKKIYIHSRCKRLLTEARLYSYKVDRVTGAVLPIIVDAHNHGWDATRYSLDGHIQARGVSGMWARLAG